MKQINTIFKLSAIAGLVFFLTGCTNNSTVKKESKTEQLPDTTKGNETKLKENPYPGLRDHSLSATPEKLQIKLDNSKTIVYGVVMDWDIGQAVATVAAFQTGDASLYISTGQIYIGGYDRENIRKAAMDFVKEAQHYLSKAKLVTETSMPDKGYVQFYILTNKGKYFIRDTAKNIENYKSDLTKLYAQGNNVITEYRTTVQEKGN